MNSDKPGNPQIPSASPELPESTPSLAGMPPETSSCQTGAVIVQGEPVHHLSSSLDGIVWGEKQREVIMCWVPLAAIIARQLPGDDLRDRALATLMDLVKLTGFEIPESTVRYFEEHFILPNV